MGCDIHTICERKIGGQWYPINAWKLSEHSTDNPEWEQLQELWDQRFYSFYTFLAGVRGEGPKITATTRGFPEDASHLARIIYESWGCDAHTPSYITFEELMNYEFPLEFQSQKDEAILHFDSHAANTNRSSLRVVFWFDN